MQTEDEEKSNNMKNAMKTCHSNTENNILNVLHVKM